MEFYLEFEVFVVLAVTFVALIDVELAEDVDYIVVDEFQVGKFIMEIEFFGT